MRFRVRVPAGVNWSYSVTVITIGFDPINLSSTLSMTSFMVLNGLKLMLLKFVLKFDCLVSKTNHGLRKMPR